MKNASRITAALLLVAAYVHAETSDVVSGTRRLGSGSRGGEKIPFKFDWAAGPYVGIADGCDEALVEWVCEGVRTIGKSEEAAIKEHETCILENSGGKSTQKCMDEFFPTANGFRDGKYALINVFEGPVYKCSGFPETRCNWYSDFPDDHIPATGGTMEIQTDKKGVRKATIKAVY